MNNIYYGFLLKIPPPHSPCKIHYKLYPKISKRLYSTSSSPTDLSASGSNSNKGLRLTLHERNSITVSVSQHEIIVGSMLGDMSATRPGPKRNTRLTIGQSKSNQSYLLSLAALLSTLIRQPNVTPNNKLDRKTGIQFYGHKFCSMSLPCLNIYREWFYPEGIKIVPNDIGQHLTPGGVAHWFMQDGSKTSDNGVTFATHCFTACQAERNLLIEVLSSKFGLSCTQQQMGKGESQKAIYVRRKSIPHFLELVCLHMHPCMLYKLPTK